MEQDAVDPGIDVITGAVVGDVAQMCQDQANDSEKNDTSENNEKVRKTVNGDVAAHPTSPREKSTWIVKILDERNQPAQKPAKNHISRVRSIFGAVSSRSARSGASARNRMTTSATSTCVDDANEQQQERRRISAEIALHTNAQFRHDNIASAASSTLHSEGRGFLVFRDQGYVDLFDFMRNNRFFKGNHRVVDVRNVCGAIVRALAFLHRNFQLVHNDVKPENILIHPSSKHCLLADFGGATPRGARDSYELVTATKYFAAPERVRRGDFDETADSWSIGMVCCELLHVNRLTCDERDGNGSTDGKTDSAESSEQKTIPFVNPFEKAYTGERWHRMMLQNFVEPLTDAIWNTFLRPPPPSSPTFPVPHSHPSNININNEPEQNEHWERGFLQKTLRIRREHRVSAQNLDL